MQAALTILRDEHQLLLDHSVDDNSRVLNVTILYVDGNASGSVEAADANAVDDFFKCVFSLPALVCVDLGCFCPCHDSNLATQK